MDFAKTVGHDALTGSINSLGGAGKARKIVGVAKGTRNVAGGKAAVDDILGGAERYLGEGYKEIAPGVFRSADGTRQFRRVDPADLNTRRGNPHVNFETIDPKTNKVIENSHVDLADR